MDQLFQDLRLGSRQLRQVPVFTLVALLTLAAGSGVNVGIVGVLRALLVREVPVERPDQLVAISAAEPTGQWTPIPSSAFDTLVERQTSCSILGAYLGNGLVTTRIRDTVSQDRFDAVSGDYFMTLGVKPALGRLLTGSDMVPGGQSGPWVAVISHDFWRGRFGGDAHVLGQVIRAGESSFEIVGVTEAGFAGLEIGSPTDVTVPLPAVRSVLGLPADWTPQVGRAIGRLRAGRSLSDARAEIRTIGPAILAAGAPPDLTARQRDALLGTTLDVTSASRGFSFLRERFRRPLAILFGLTVWMLLVACANLASLLLARSAARRQEFDVRLALGASRPRLWRQLVVESLLLSACGVALGVPLGWITARGLAGLMTIGDRPNGLVVTMDWQTFAVAALIAVATAMLFSTAPMWVARESRPPAPGGSRTTSDRVLWWNERIVVGQIMLSVMLLVAAGLLAASLRDARGRDPGFRSEGVLLARLAAQPQGYADLQDEIYYPSLVGRLEALPGVRSAALSTRMPVTGLDVQFTQPVNRAEVLEPGLQAVFTAVSPGFFRTLGIGLRIGRDVAWSDAPPAPGIAVVSRDLARRLFGEDAQALGRLIRVGSLPAHQRLEIIGIVENTALLNVQMPDVPLVFGAWLQQPPGYSRWPFVQVRANGDPAALVTAMRRVIDSQSHEFVEFARTLDEQIARSLLRERVLARFATLFAGFAALLVALGLYGSLSYAVARRTREIGVRVALGASSAAIRGLIVGRGLRLAVLGLALGTLGAVAAGGALLKMVPGLQPRRPLVFAGAALVVVLTALVAACMPAQRAASIEPVEALRTD